MPRQVTLHLDVPPEAAERDLALAAAIELQVGVGECRILDQQYRGPADCVAPEQWPQGGYDVTVLLPS